MIYRDNIEMLNELIASEDGVFTTAQASRFGIPRDALSYAAKTGRIERVCHGAYRASNNLDDGLDELKAIWKLTAPEKFSHERIGSAWDGVCVCGHSAAFVLEIGDFYASPYAFFSGSRINSRKKNARFITRKIHPDDVTIRNGLPVTRPERTIADLVSLHEDTSLVSDALLDAIRKYGGSTFSIDRLASLVGKKTLGKLIDAMRLGKMAVVKKTDNLGHAAIIEEEIEWIDI